MQCVVVTPEETVLDASVQFVALPLFDGEVGIAKGHSPMIGRLGFGEMRIVDANGTQTFYVDGGFVQVDADVVSVLTNRAIRAEDVDADGARTQLSEAMGKPAHGEDHMAIRDRLATQARAQMRVAERAKGESSETH